ncbi:MAG: glycosyltransferase family 2 protein [Tannerella sp.]|nr:glycosyltransferase family 2 protein [Tannerella sp.]
MHGEFIMVTIGIPTYNRKDILKIMAASLYNSSFDIPHNIRIYDDCSTEYGKNELREIFPTAVSIKRNEINLNADKNMYSMYADFLTTGDDYFFNADSDIIFNSQWLNISMELLKKTGIGGGVLSVFNANSHPTSKIIDRDLCIKETVGAAGTLFARNRLAELLNHFDSIEYGEKSFDWKWSEYFTSKGIPIYCVNNSLVQHIGYDGQNSNLYFDFGKNYKVGTIEEGQIINDIFEKYADDLRNKIITKHNELANNLGYHIKRCLIIIVKRLLPKKVFETMKSWIRSSKYDK